MFATLEAPSIAQDLRIECVRGSESLARPYVFDLQLTVAGGEIDLAEAVGAAATLRLARDGDAPQLFHGVLASVELVVQTSAWALYQATLVPKVWHLGLTRRSRVFTKQTVPQIIEAVLKAADLTSSDFELRLTGDYPEEELVVQYQESDLDFIQRWMEHEGIYYFFEQTDAGAKMVVVDAAAAHDKMVDGAVRYHPLMGHDASAGACFDSFTVRHDATVAAVRLADYDYARPALDLSARREVSPRGFGQMSLHGARFFDPSQADRYATLRAEELAARRVLHHASGTALHVSAGYHVELADHPSDKLNARYLATEVNHFVNQLAGRSAGSVEPTPAERDNALAGYLKPTYDDVYRVQATFIEARVPYRPPLRTPQPRVWGIENGVVDGEADSPYAQIDDQGRYLVKFQFDESDLSAGKASTYVRMMQPHGGTTEGFHFPLRKGTEVVFSFLGGDPDRPVIAGVVPNTVNPSPVSAANHTQNVIRTGANNHIILDDADGKEFISIRTPNHNSGLYFGNPIGASLESFDGEGLHEWGTDFAGSVCLFTEGNTKFFFNGAWVVNCRDILENSRGPVTEIYKGPHETTVEGSGRIEDVTGGVSENYKGGHRTKVTGDRSEEVTAAVTETYGSQSIKVGPRAIFAKSEFHDVAGLFHVDALTVKSTSSELEAVARSSAVVDGGSLLTLRASNIVIEGTSSVTIKTPDQKHTDPNKTVVGAVWDSMWSMSSEAVGLKLGWTSIKVEGAGLKLENKGANVANMGVRRKAAGAEVANEGAKAGGGGILSELRGIITLA